MVRHAIVTLVAAILVVAGGCSRLALDAKAEEAKLLKRDAEWAAAAAGKDVEKIISYWSDDALVMPPGQPSLEGKAALRSFVTDSLKIPGFQIRWKSDKVSFSPDGKLAYMRGTNETTVTGSDGAPTTLHGRAVTIWRRDSDGQWRCVVDIWNAAPPLALKDNRERPR
jgi:ketosteroid isomerase-like protein